MLGVDALNFCLAQNTTGSGERGGGDVLGAGMRRRPVHPRYRVQSPRRRMS
jgi:hypothetical protein